MTEVEVTPAKWIDRVQQGEPSTMLTPAVLALAQKQAEEFRKRAEAAEKKVTERGKSLETMTEYAKREQARARKAEAEAARLREGIESALKADSEYILRVVLHSTLAHKGGGSE